MRNGIRKFIFLMRKKVRALFSLRWKVLLFCLFVSVSVLVFCVWSFGNIYSQYLGNAYNELLSASSKVAAELNQYLNSVDSFTTAQFASQSIGEIIALREPSKRREKLREYKSWSSSNEYKEAVWTTAMSSQLISSYFFIDEDNYYEFPFSYIHNDEENIRVYLESVANPSSSPLFYISNASARCFYYVRNVYNLPTAKTSGTIVQCINYEALKYLVSNLPLGLKVWITDLDGVIYYSDDWKESGTVNAAALQYPVHGREVFELNENDLVSLYSIAMAGTGRLLVVCSCNKDTIFTEVFRKMLPYLIAALVFICLLNLLLIPCVVKAIRAMNLLLSGFREVSGGNYMVRLPQSRDGDVVMIVDGFNNMTEKIRNMFDVVREEEALRKASEIKFLQAQINPHFLFNVLTTIRIRAKLGGDEGVYQMLLALGELIAAGISNDRTPLIPLEEEMHYIKRYLYLQKIRFEDRLSYDIDIAEPQFLRCAVPKLCVESIVENAVIHGLENKIGCGNIRICVHGAEEDLEISIWDNGVGFDVEQIGQSGAHSGIGLANVERRLKLIFGEQYGLCVHSEIGEGTCVRMRIPRREMTGNV